MLRADLLKQLEVVAPALSDNQLIPIMTHFWFTGEHVMAYDDQIALMTPFKTQFTGAIPGRVLLELMKASTAKEIKVVVDNEGVSIKAAGARFKLALLPPDGFVFDMPDLPAGDYSLPAGKDQFLQGIETCMKSVSTDTSIPDQLGVTFIPGNGSLLMFATNGATLSRVKLKTDKKKAKYSRVILSAKFCEQMVELIKKSESHQLSIAEDHALLVADNTTLFGRTVHSSHPLDYEGVYNHHVSDEQEELIAVPKLLRLVLQRAMVITDSKLDETKTSVTCEDNEFQFISESSRGVVEDKFVLKEAQHPNVNVKLSPKLLKAGLDTFDKFLITRKCAIMAKGEQVYLVSTTEG